MLSISDIQAAAEELLGQRFAGDTVYRDLAPRDFKRPSFLVECGPVKMEDAGCAALQIGLTVVITIFTAVDDYHNSHIGELQQRLMAVLELFAVGYLRVNDRALHVAGNEGDYQFDFATVRVTLSYADDRPGGEETFQAMGAVHTEIVNKEA